MTDTRLLRWARAGARAGAPPPLWFFTDSLRVPDPRPVVARLPKGLSGVVFRHDADPARESLGRDLARLCRRRRLWLVVAGDPSLAARLGAGTHLRAGRRPLAASGLPRRRKTLVTSSAHSLPDLRRAARGHADLVFLSPVFTTQSHPGAPVLGPLRWLSVVRNASVRVAALGGITGGTIRRLPRRLCCSVGFIGAMAGPDTGL